MWRKIDMEKLNFKTIFNTVGESQNFQKLCFEKGIFWSEGKKDVIDDSQVIICENSELYCLSYTDILSNFICEDKPLITTNDAILLIANLPDYKEETTQSNFIIYDIDERGFFDYKIGEDWIVRIKWDNICHRDLNNLIFAGWDFNGKWVQTRIGIDEDNELSDMTTEWIKPVIPKRIRFYKG
jgi:hypothetical protein